MAQFRTSADILDEILRRAGESDGGNSPFETAALLFANKVHHAIIGGGNIFNLEVDEDWKWARARYPFALTLEPAYVTGSVTFVQNDITCTFSSAPSSSLEGWYVQATGYATVYRITQHSANATSFKIDSPFVDTGGTYTFRAFKTDYDLIPAYLYIDSTNDKIDFYEVQGTQLTATLTHGSYTPDDLITHVITKLANAGTSANYSGSYDSVLRTFTLTSSLGSGKIFTLLGASGTNVRRSALPTLGFDRLDLSASNADSTGTYVSKYIVNGINRLTEPFRVYQGLTAYPYIESTDAQQLNVEYPPSMIDETVPCKFAKISETSDGTFTVRFNSYPAQRTKVLIDWIPVPIDLQDNASSVPLIPRKDIDVLINGTAMYIAFEKSDDKFGTLENMTKAQLESMGKKNTLELYRTSPTYGQMIPRSDLSRQRRQLRYGYTVSGGTSGSSNTVPNSLTKVTLSYTDLQTAATSNTVTAYTLGSNRTLFAVLIKHSQAFSGGSISGLTLNVGINGDSTKFINGFSVYQAVSASAQDSALVIYYPGTATGITVTATATGANLSALTQGSVDIWFEEQVVT